MPCLGQFCFLTGGLYPLHGNDDCEVTLYFNNDKFIKTTFSVSINKIFKKKKKVNQISPDFYLIAVIKNSTIEAWDKQVP